MQYNTAGQPKSRPTRDYAPKKHKNKKLANLPLLLLFVALLALMYVLFPKEAGRHVGHSQYEGLVISEVMSANNSAVPDENGNFPDWLEIYNGSDHDIDMEGVMISHRSDRISFPFPAYTLKAGERVIVYASNSWQKDDPTKPFHGKFKISSAGAHLALYDPDMYAELICDETGIHVDPDMLKMVVRTKGVEKIILITDSMPADGDYKNNEADGIAWGPDLNYDYEGHLAGSHLTLDSACRNLMAHTGYGLCHAIRMASLNPAKLLGLDRELGSIALGKKANLLLIDDLVHVKKVFLAGREVSEPRP